MTIRSSILQLAILQLTLGSHVSRRQPCCTSLNLGLSGGTVECGEVSTTVPVVAGRLPAKRPRAQQRREPMSGTIGVSWGQGPCSSSSWFLSRSPLLVSSVTSISNSPSPGGVLNPMRCLCGDVTLTVVTGGRLVPGWSQLRLRGLVYNDPSRRCLILALTSTAAEHGRMSRLR